MGYDTGRDELLAVATLIIVMALIEVVLLAGPAFAVGARRHARTLALIAASGGTPGPGAPRHPGQRRRARAGRVRRRARARHRGRVGGPAARAALQQRVVRSASSCRGATSPPSPPSASCRAILASVVPAWLASRQDVVAVLAGRRGDRKPRASTPVVGLALLGAGDRDVRLRRGDLRRQQRRCLLDRRVRRRVGARHDPGGAGRGRRPIARLARRLPLTPRYAARDAARHRTRTVPAVAAVAATVAGVVALGIATESQELADEKTYTAQAPMGTGVLAWTAAVLPGEEAPDPAPVWDRIEAAVAEAAPGVGHERAPRSVREPRVRRWVDLHLRPADRPRSGLLPVHLGSAGGRRRHLGRARARRGHGRHRRPRARGRSGGGPHRGRGGSSTT